MGSPKPCLEKVRYSTPAEARRAVSTIRRVGERREKKPSRPYPCPHCHGYHLTSEPA